MRRPAGIVVIAMLMLATGVIYFLQGIRVLGWVVFEPGGAFTNVALTGWLTLILALIWIAAAVAFLGLRPWAWTFAVIVAAFSMVEAFFGSLNGWQLGDLFVATIVPILILYYLGTETIKTAFGHDG